MITRATTTTFNRKQTTTEGTTQFERRLPVGAEVQPNGGVHFRVWAPRRSTVCVQLSRSLPDFEKSAWIIELQPEQDWYFSGFVPDAEAGVYYKYRFEKNTFPDPASRYQPLGPHGPSQVINPSQFAWTDKDWKGVSRVDAVIYEMHVGTFTGEGTWQAAMEQLPELARLGITIIEVMPVADFCGRFGWGYDGVNMYAPTRLYGTPDDFRAFVDRAHSVGIGVILDVVYNHLGPDGNYLREFSDAYFSQKYKCEWGEALNFDGDDAGPVREFFACNASYWLNEFHVDGLRLDATQQIFDASEDNIMAVISREVREAGAGRLTYIVAENEPQHSKLVRAEDKGGYGMDALWNDDFHHSAIVALTGKNEAYYTDYKGTPQEFISCAKWGYLYQGQRYKWQKQRRGTPALDLEPTNFVCFTQNHDQVANSLRGHRIHQMTSLGEHKAMTALLLLGPWTPMLFQGQEFAASQPFLYFADHNPELAKLVAAGRKEFLTQFPSIACPDCLDLVHNPESEETFNKCKLDFSERQKHGPIYQLHADLLKLRKEDLIISGRCRTKLDGAVLSDKCFVLRYFNEMGNDRLLLINLGTNLHLDPAPEPLLAPIENHLWRMLWSSESPQYGGYGTPALDNGENWRIPGRATVVMEPDFSPEERKRQFECGEIGRTA